MSIFFFPTQLGYMKIILSKAPSPRIPFDYERAWLYKIIRTPCFNLLVQINPKYYGIWIIEINLQRFPAYWGRKIHQKWSLANLTDKIPYFHRLHSRTNLKNVISHLFFIENWSNLYSLVIMRPCIMSTSKSN